MQAKIYALKKSKNDIFRRKLYCFASEKKYVNHSITFFHLKNIQIEYMGTGWKAGRPEGRGLPWRAYVDSGPLVVGTSS